MAKVNVSFDGLRANMTSDMIELQQTLKEIIDTGVLAQYEIEELNERFNQCACNVNGLNCVYASDIEGFSNLEDGPMVPMLDDEDDL